MLNSLIVLAIASIIFYSIFRINTYIDWKWSIYSLKSIKLSVITISTMNDVHNSCLDTMYYYLHKNTVMAEEVIVVISNVSTVENIEQINSITKNWNRKIPNLRVFIRKILYSPSDNRNFGASRAKYEYLSFIDIDDLISKYKIEFTKKAFRDDKSMDMMIHSMTYYNNDILDLKIYALNDVRRYRIPYDYGAMKNNYTTKILEKKISLIQTYCCALLDIRDVLFHNALVSMKRFVWRELKYIQIGRHEDSYFNTRAIIAGYKVGLYNAKLVYYTGFINRTSRCIKRF